MAHLKPDYHYFKYYYKKQLFILLLQILITKCQTVRTEVFVGKDELLHKECGYLKVFAPKYEQIFTGTHTRNEMIVPIREGERMPYSKFENIHDQFENGSVILTNNQCKIEICGVTTGEDFAGGCKDFWKSESPVSRHPYSNSYTISSVSCGCQKNRTNCSNENCNTKSMAELIQSNTKICGVLFQETDCQDCYHNGVLLEENKKFETHHALSVKSFLLRPGCKMERTTFIILFLHIPNTILYYRSERNLSLSNQIGGENFLCTCVFQSTNKNYDIILPKIMNTSRTTQIQLEPSSKASNLTRVEEPEENKNKDSSVSVNTIFLNGLVTLFGLGGIITLILVVYVLKFKKPKIHQPIVVTKEETRNFKKSLKNKSSSIGMEDLALGNTKAFTLPYDVKFELKRDAIRFNRDDPNSIIGEGQFGIVYKGIFANVDSDRFQDVAVKTIRPSLLRQVVTVKSLVHEIKILSSLGYHPNIVYFVGACTINLEKEDVFLVLKLCHGGSLKNYLKEERNNLKRNKEISRKLFNLLLKWSEEIATGMEFLTSKNVVHIDLSAKIILLTNELIATISDFGLSRKGGIDLGKEENLETPIPLMSLSLVMEFINGKTYSHKSDVWGYGDTIWEIFSLGDDPYGQMNTFEIYSFLSSGKQLPCPKHSTTEIYEEMRKCWNQNQSARPCFTDLKSFFKNFSKDNLRERE